MKTTHVLIAIICAATPLRGSEDPKGGLFGALGRKISRISSEATAKGELTTIDTIMRDITTNELTGRPKWINKRVRLDGYIYKIEKNLFGDYVDIHFTEVDPSADETGRSFSTAAILTFKHPGNLDQLTRGLRAEAYGDVRSIEGSVVFLENPALKILKASLVSPEVSLEAAKDYAAKLKIPIEQKQVVPKPSLKDRKEYGELILKAGQSGDLATLKEAILAGGMVNVIEDGSTVNALFRVIVDKNISSSKKGETVELLLEYGANPNATFGFNSCMHVVARQGMVDIALLLLRAGANPNPDPQPRMETPLQLAQMSKNVAMVSLLRAAGAK